MIKLRKIFFAVFIVSAFAYSCILFSQDATEPASGETAGNTADKGDPDAKPAEPVKKKPKKRIKVKYRDINVAMGVRKEIYLNFPISDTAPRPPTNNAIFKVEVNRKADNPDLPKDRLVLIGQQPGITDLWVYDNQDILRYVYNVTVTEKNLKRMLGFLKREFKNVEGLKMYIREKRIVLDGEILLPEDIARIHQVIGGLEGTDISVFKTQYRLSPTLFKVVAQKMQEEIGSPTVQVEVINQRFVLKGEVKSQEELTDVVLKGALYLPKYFYTPLIGDPTQAGELTMPADTFRDKPIIDFFLKVIEPDKPVNKVVKVSVYFVEIQKGFENNFNFSWAPSIDTSKTNANLSWTNAPANDNNTGVPLPNAVTTITGIVNNFIPKLQDAIRNNKGRVINSTAVTVEDGKQGTVAKQTVYPYVVATATNTMTQFAKVGINVSATPRILGSDTQKSDDLNLDLNISISQVVGKTAGASSIPITSEDTLQTTINLKSDTTAAIGGIVINNLTKTYMDGSDDSNVIFSLSRSKDFQTGKSQFVIFVTPTILSTASEGNDSVKEKFRVK